jgi:RNA polymerase sigma-B factor
MRSRRCGGALGEVMTQQSAQLRGSGRRQDRERHDVRPQGAGRVAGGAHDHGAKRKQRLIEQYLPLADKVARRYAHTTEPLEDLVQVARLGVMKAADRWDPSRGPTFASFAVPTMTGELRRYFRDSAWMIRPPRHLQELHLAVGRVREQLYQELGREPSAADVAARLDRTVEDVLDALQAGDAYSPASLDVPLHDNDDGDVRQDLVADPRSTVARSDDALVLEELSAELSARDREVLRLRFMEDMLQREIAERVGCSQMQVSRILGDALPRLQAAAADAT